MTAITQEEDRSRGTRGFRGRYLSLTSYKRDGSAVATPVWFVQENGTLLIHTDASSGKIKRIRRNPNVRVALCSASGRLLGPQVSGTATVLAESEVKRVEQLMKRKYRMDLLIIGPLRYVQSALGLGKTRTQSVIVAVTLAP